MITGNEPIYADPARCAEQSHSNQDPLSLDTGITLKQHMVIEFTKAFIGIEYSSFEACVSSAIQTANHVIKQLNDEDK